MRRALAVAAVLALLGCGSSGDDGRASDHAATTDPSDATTSTERPAASGPTTVAGPGEVPDGRDVVVTSITDGDTFRAGDERVRLTGIDTPEVSGGVECYGREASAALERMIPVGTEVRLVGDVDTVDRYERTLAYVYRLPDGLDVNLAMAAEGYAQPLTVPPNVAREADFAEAAREAREAGRGLWSACEDDTSPSSTTSPPAPSTASTTDPLREAPATVVGPECDPSYPDVCIPPAPPDLDCADIPHRRFTVLPPDPHGFDGGGDGVGCESG